jgi:hypothetical protein
MRSAGRIIVTLFAAMLTLAELTLAELTLAGRPAAAQDATHVLRYTPPANVFRAGIEPAEDYSFNGFNASLQVYQFRRFTGDIRQAFQTSLLRDWIAPMHKEENVAGQPTFGALQIAGADLAVVANFAETRAGLPRPHTRMLIVAGQEAAIVDASAGTMQSWQQAVPVLNAMAATLRVETASAPPPLAPSAGRAVAGLYQGIASKFMALTGRWESALHFYLLSADGRVYRAYDRVDLPGGNIGLFDFDAAGRRDPVNVGRYTVDGSKLVIHMENGNRETIVTEVPQGGVLTIHAVAYRRQ